MSDVATVVSKSTPKDQDKVAAAICRFVAHVLNQADTAFHGQWTVQLKRQTKSKIRFKVLNFDNNGLSLRVMPGDNGTCWDCELKPPNGENLLYVGRELSLWNGYDGHNVPPAVLANRGEEPTDESVLDLTKQAGVSLSAKIEESEKRSQAYLERKERIAALRSEYNELLAKADGIEHQIETLEEEEANDYEGQAALEVVSALRRLMSL